MSFRGGRWHKRRRGLWSYRATSDANHFIVNNMTEAAGDGDGFTVGVVFWAFAAATSDALFDRTHGAQAYDLTTLAGGGVRFRVRDGLAVLQAISSSNSITVGAINVAFGRYDGTGGTLDIRLNGTDQTQTTGLSGYTSPDATDSAGISVDHLGTATSDSTEVVGVGYSTTRLTDAQLSTWESAIRGAYRMVDPPAGAEWTIDAANAWALPASWAPTTGSETATKTGNPEIYLRPAAWADGV